MVRHQGEEYWIVDPLTQTLDVYRQQEGTLVSLATLTRQDTLTSPLLPGLACVVGTLSTRAENARPLIPIMQHTWWRQKPPGPNLAPALEVGHGQSSVLR